jgi:hypothetical protein
VIGGGRFDLLRLMLSARRYDRQWQMRSEIVNVHGKSRSERRWPKLSAGAEVICCSPCDWWEAMRLAGN